ncbi:helix-turn-helix transcriptional regulator [Streptomyces sp. NPDC016309]|uniref:helix-turn-helix transcriptional regulator n=1 Tax=Streptomyces sp. NPDC016309 TaxID=3364965 RepID=UPI0036F96AA9
MCHPSWGPALTAARRRSDLARLRRVRDRIDREYARPLDLLALARGENLPAGLLSRQFRLAYGMSPYAYLTARRMDRAAALPRRGGLTVAEVRPAVGCASPGTFGARFTERVGVPPGACLRATATATV